jgi:hypothetical protein
MLRSVLGVIGGLMAGFWIIQGITKFGNRFYPPPSTLDFAKEETVLEAIRTTPIGLLLILLASYAIGTFISAGIAARVAPTGKIGHGMIIGGVFCFLNLVQNLGLPYPVWFKIAGALVFLPMAFLGARLVTLAPTQKPESFPELD